MCNFSTSRGNQEKSIDIKDRKKKKNIREARERESKNDRNKSKPISSKWCKLANQKELLD